MDSHSQYLVSHPRETFPKSCRVYASSCGSRYHGQRRPNSSLVKENFEKRTTIKSLFTAHTSTNNRVLEASYHTSLFIAKTGKNHTIGENLIKPSISAFLKTVLGDKDVKDMPLSKNTVCRGIDEMGEDIEKQLVEKLKTRKFSVQMDESTLRDSEAVSITYARYIDKGHFAEECCSVKD
ncbi:SCAN domain-containing protein 3 [Trichonephila clavipes]|nr:SCAN domain-containing protein 3 [Trichonephila clavipes]